MLSLFGALALGWGLGANDSANAFGTAVSSRMLQWRFAAILGSVFVLLGAVLQGTAGVHTLSNLSSGASGDLAAYAAVGAALSVALMTILSLPVSTSQAVVGGLLSVGMINNDVNLQALSKVIVCWIGTPVGAAVSYLLLYRFLKWVFQFFRSSIFSNDPLIRIGLILCGCYGAYALGANNVANVSVSLVNSQLFDPQTAVLFGGLSIALGIMTMSKPVMLTVGRSITQVDTFSALIVTLASAITVHFYAMVGVPVSSSQAVVGAVIGIGLSRGLHTLRFRPILYVFSGWLATPLIAFCVTWILIKLNV